MKKNSIIIFLTALFIAAALLVSCTGKEEAPNKESAADTALDFESIDDGTNEPVTETREPETEKAPETETDAPETETGAPETKEATPGASSGAGLKALELAEKLIGTKFSFGGIGPDEFDNSGFIYYIVKESGAEVPRLTVDIQKAGAEVKRESIAPGDILVFANEIGGGAEFVGIYAGDGQFIACNNPDTPTKLQPIGNYWGERLITARRVGVIVGR